MGSIVVVGQPEPQLWEASLTDGLLWIRHPAGCWDIKHEQDQLAAEEWPAGSWLGDGRRIQRPAGSWLGDGGRID